MSITPWKFAFFTNNHCMNRASLDKAQAARAGPRFTQIEAASNKSDHLVNKAQVAQAGPLFTQIEAASNKSNHLVAIKGLHKAPLWTKLRQSRQDHFSHRLKQPQTNLTIWWWKGFTQSTLIRNFLNIDYVTDTNQNPSKTITTKPLQTKRKVIMLQPLL